MSAAAGLQAALVTAVRGAAGLEALTAVFDAPPVRSALPYAVIDEPVLARWGGALLAGREGRIAIQLHDAGERPVRLRAMIAAVETVAEGLSGALDDGWHVAGVRLARSRIARGAGDRWTAQSEFAVKLYRTDI